jgi:hypothetical protein
VSIEASLPYTEGPLLDQILGDESLIRVDARGVTGSHRLDVASPCHVKCRSEKAQTALPLWKP